MQIHNPHCGRAEALLELGERKALRRTIKDFDTELNVLKAKAFKDGCKVREASGKLIDVQPKWLFGEITSGLRSMPTWKAKAAIRGFLGYHRQRSHEPGCCDPVIIPRKFITWMQKIDN